MFRPGSYVQSSLAIIWLRKKELISFVCVCVCACVCVCVCVCLMFLPPAAMGWSVICYSDFPRHTFFIEQFK